MNHPTIAPYRSHAWLDSLAIGMSVLCAIHCLVTPLIVVFLPVLASTFWAHKNFHLWMILLVVPTTAMAMFLGCRKHKDKLMLALGGVGLTILTAVALYEAMSHAPLGLQESSLCSQCTQCESGNLLTRTTLANITGAVFLTSAHVRNFLFCRKANCCVEGE